MESSFIEEINNIIGSDKQVIFFFFKDNQEILGSKRGNSKTLFVSEIKFTLDTRNTRRLTFDDGFCNQVRPNNQANNQSFLKYSTDVSPNNGDQGFR